MTWQDRDYYRDDPSGGGGFSARMRPSSVTTWLIIINAAVFLLDGILTGSRRAGALSPSDWGNFNIPQAVYGLQLWRFFTYQFLHWDLLHIVFNMIGLYFFGPLIERWWGSCRYLAFYLLCGLSGAVIYTLLSLLPGVLPDGGHGIVMGASGSIFGILVAAAVLYPHQRVMLMFPPIPMALRTMALVCLGITVVTILVGGRNAGGEAAHLGGAALGFALTKFPWTLDWADALANRARNRGAGSWDRKLKAQAKERQRETKEQAQVDRILDKVRDQGLASLTDREKKALRQATDRQRKD